jgi:hypothetical protein
MRLFDRRATVDSFDLIARRAAAVTSLVRPRRADADRDDFRRPQRDAFADECLNPASAAVMRTGPGCSFCTV